MSKFFAYCFRSGQVAIGTKIPDGAIPLAVTTNKGQLERAVSVCARHSYDNTTWLIGGIVDAKNDDDAFEAMMQFGDEIKKRMQSARTCVHAFPDGADECIHCGVYNQNGKQRIEA